VGAPLGGVHVQRARRLPSKPRDLLAVRRQTALFLPLLAATSALIILFVGTVRHMNEVALILALATLLATGGRLALSTYGLRMLSEKRHHQAVTDELTGLSNRRQLFAGLKTIAAARLSIG
jgi:GGDEF domain-containing protein